ncbi:MAG: GntR family transcriptional regulator [Paracoccaceae bacterium]
MARISAYESFKDRLMTGELKPGQFVTQRELATLADVPLSIAREAIQKLQHEKLLKVHPQRGIQITDITTRFIREAFQIREILESNAIRNFAEKHQDEAKSLLDKTREILASAKKDTSVKVLEKAIEVDWRMHDMVIEKMDNSLLTEMYQINATRLRLIRVNIRFSPDRVLGALSEHVEILESCARGDADSAESAVAIHINTALGQAIKGA